MTGPALLVLGGALLEAAGILLIAAEIRSDRQRALALASQGRPVLLSATIAGRSNVGADLTTGREPTLEERVDGLEVQVGALKMELAAQDEALREEIREHVNRAATSIHREARLADQYLRDFLTQLLTGDLGRRKLGVALLLVGLGVSTVGNVWGYA